MPSPNVAEDHQTLNAKSLADVGAAELLAEKDLDQQMVSKIVSLLLSESLRNEMRTKLKQRSRPDAAEAIAADILELVARKGVAE